MVTIAAQVLFSKGAGNWGCPPGGHVPFRFCHKLLCPTGRCQRSARCPGGYGRRRWPTPRATLVQRASFSKRSPFWWDAGTGDSDGSFSLCSSRLKRPSAASLASLFSANSRPTVQALAQALAPSTELRCVCANTGLAKRRSNRPPLVPSQLRCQLAPSSVHSLCRARTATAAGGAGGAASERVRVGGGRSQAIERAHQPVAQTRLNAAAEPAAGGPCRSARVKGPRPWKREARMQHATHNTQHTTEGTRVRGSKTASSNGNAAHCVRPRRSERRGGATPCQSWAQPREKA